MKVLIMADRARVEKYMPPLEYDYEKVYMPGASTVDELAAAAGDAEFIFVDAVTPVTAELIARMPKLRLIHSEGVAFDKIDCAAAAKRGIYVCNNKGANAAAVAEHSIMLMMALSKNLVVVDAASRAGEQIAVKTRMMVEGIRELSEYTVGLIGFGDIGREVSKRLKSFNTPVYYYDVAGKLDGEDYAVYSPLDELLAKCDVISLHVPVFPSTTGMVNKEFLEKMRPGAYLINTARGELVVNEDVRAALENGTLAAAAFDTIAPEPVTPDNPLLNMTPDAMRRIIITPHIAGVTTGMFKRAPVTIWGNFARVIRGEQPVNVVNAKLMNTK